MNDNRFEHEFLAIERAAESGLITWKSALTRVALLGASYPTSDPESARFMAMRGIPVLTVVKAVQL